MAQYHSSQMRALQSLGCILTQQELCNFKELAFGVHLNEQSLEIQNMRFNVIVRYVALCFRRDNRNGINTFYARFYSQYIRNVCGFHKKHKSYFEVQLVL